ncbi:MAG: AGE family epimerase/isomerase [Candidatus Kaistia colombiensis]|nr:MAG: AGE family epimerase/isomerase [Kaistia sp.]
MAGGRPGYIETVPADADQEATDARSTMVTARLVYAFSLGHRIAPDSGSRRAAEHGLRFLLDRCQVAGEFRHGVLAGGDVSSATADLYDLAFVLLALGGYTSATGDCTHLATAEDLGFYLDTLRDTSQSGYREPGPTGPLRQQFPNMHLFEAFQLLARLSPEGPWLARAETLVDLVETRLIAEDGSIAEWYRPDWCRLEGGPGSEREIGHQFEWAWLLYRHAETSGNMRAADLADRLYRFGCEAASIDGKAPFGLLRNGLDAAGRSLDERRPLWPLTELLRVAIAAEALGRPGPAATVADDALEAIFTHFVDAPTGLWVNERDSSGAALVPSSPTRLLYHLLPAFAAYAQAREPGFVDDNPILDRPNAAWPSR